MSGAQKLKSWLALGAVCATTLLLLAITVHLTRERILRNERAWFAARIDTLIPPTLHDNDLLDDVLSVTAPESLGDRKPLAIYRARLRGVPTAAIITAVAEDGYNGPIELLVAVDYAGAVLGVHILTHHETPGMGDAFARDTPEQPGVTWLETFKGRSLTNPDTRGWNVRKDGGEFAQFTSATITPRAIVHAVQRALDYYQRHREQLFRTTVS